ncbi:MAG: hypothetical protein JW740_00520 [Candidatus Zambryskibacteria bacterium]|nr:hypothetical protein [Candidatus Zambryskibacteria bacterium]
MRYEIKIEKLPKSEVKLEISLPAEFLDEARKKAIRKFCAELEVPGFRKGNVPENIAIEKVGENKILQEAVNILLQEHFPKVIEQEKLDIIGRPNISITKLGLGSPTEFKVEFATLPVFKLPDYKEIAKKLRIANNESRKEKKIEVTDKEVDDVLLQIRKNKAHFDWHKSHPEEKSAQGGSALDGGHNHPEIRDEDLPPLDDKLAEEAGNFKNLDELKAKIKENIKFEKENKETEKLRAEIMEELLKATKIEVPDILIESEIDKALAQMKGDIGRIGVKFEDYLKQVKKTEEDLKKELSSSSEKKAGIQLIFNKIAEAEKLEPNKEILENEIKHLMEHYPDASEQNARIYVTTILLNQEVLKLLENQK